MIKYGIYAVYRSTTYTDRTSCRICGINTFKIYVNKQIKIIKLKENTLSHDQTVAYYAVFFV